MRILIFFSVLLLNLHAAIGEEPVPIRQSLPMKRGEGLGTKGYSPLEDELPFIKKITEKEINLWASIKMPKASNMSDAEWKKMEEKRIESEKNLIPIEKYELAKQAGVYVGWFGIVRSLEFDAAANQTQLLVEHKYFDGLTDLHLQIVSIYGAGDFQVVVPGKVTADQIPKLGLIRVYGLVSKGKDEVPIVKADFIRVWDWGLFAFMDYGKDKSDPAWIKLRKTKSEDVYDSSPTKKYYEDFFGTR